MKSLFRFKDFIIPLSKFRQSAKDYLAKLNEQDQPLVLTQNGHSAAIVLSPESFEKLQYEKELFRAIAEGERDLAQGKVTEHEKFFREFS